MTLPPMIRAARGLGAFGEVHLARRISDGLLVAVKRVNLGALTDERALVDAKHEATMAGPGGSRATCPSVFHACDPLVSPVERHPVILTERCLTGRPYSMLAALHHPNVVQCHGATVQGKAGCVFTTTTSTPLTYILLLVRASVRAFLMKVSQIPFQGFVLNLPPDQC
jgi:serine/threonine protein kinase